MTMLDWGGRNLKDHGPAALIGECRECGRQGPFHLVTLASSRRRHLIHVVRYGFRYAVMCPRCTYGVELFGADVGRAQDLARATAAWRAGRISDTQYDTEVRWLGEKLGD